MDESSAACGPPEDAPTRVLMASHDRVFAASLAKRLQYAGLEVQLCVPGPQCTASLRELAQCDVLVVEIAGTAAGERELVEAARASSPLVEVITISAKAAVPEAVRAFRSGLFAVLEHPVDADQLLHTVLEASRRKHRAERRIRELDQMANGRPGRRSRGGGPKGVEEV